MRKNKDFQGPCLKKIYGVAVDIPITGTVYCANDARVYVKIHSDITIKKYWSRELIKIGNDLLVEIPNLQGKKYQTGEKLTVIPTRISLKGLIFGNEA